ncbi:O-fucosyltransferase family protein isoform 1 [Hibiscus syriacus]|uniref:non-specific serine/threonine protein kinase n=1 Tax=Hibiscus syriacus TaxID=106335 RepID=A0A6A3C3M1_HIBSY|nr:O-fucosyltransferase family protein isoform 1 [Hibiscus syriacus]
MISAIFFIIQLLYQFKFSLPTFLGLFPFINMKCNPCFQLLYVLWIQCFVVCSSAVTVRNLSTDQNALVQFKDGIVDPHNVLANNWTTSTSVCKWVGVSCGVTHERVVALNLTCMNLTGTIPPHLGNLSFLHSLDLGINNFHGHLPKELGQLNRLRLLRLSFNGLNGEIPSWIGNLHRVKILKMRSNKFTGTIPQTLVNMFNLEILNLGFNQLFGQIPSSIFRMTSLKEIWVDHNSLSGSLPEDLCHHLPKLEILLLSVNNLSGYIPSSVGKCSNLQWLHLSINKFNGIIPKSIGNLTQLKQLYLGDNNLEGEIPKELGNLFSLEILNIQIIKGLTGQIPPSIFNISSLMIINLANNSLSGGLPDDLCHRLPELEELYLDTNQLSGNIPTSINKCSNLQVLSLYDNKFRGSLPRNIWNSTMLEGIYLHDNNLEGNLPPLINVPKLERLVLYGNKLSGNIPSSISNASMLKRLELQKNFFFGLIPNTLGNLRHLEWLNIGFNNLTTESATHEWTFLSSLSNCRNLTKILVSENPLHGVLPSYIGNFSTSLQYFFAYNCKLKGNIPMEIGNLSSVLLLQLGNNQLSGSIPTSIGRMVNLQVLNLTSNILRGPISESICGLERLYTLHLSLNELHGPIHTCFGNLTSLGFLDLASNKLSSAIPSTLWNLKDILELDLSSNYLNNSHALDVGVLRSLLKLNLSNNLLTGDISSTIGSLQTLLSLDLSDNNLHGHIPQSFGGLISLEFLDLSHNNLSGTIPESLEKLSYLKYFNVSFNRLEGEIPTNGCFPNFSSTSFISNYALCGPSRLLVPPCKKNIHKSSKMMILHALSYGLPTIGIVIVLIVLAIMYRKCHGRSTTLPIQDDSSFLNTWRRISRSELSQATNEFEESNLLGSGSFGYVYRGRLSDGTEVAIKVFNLQIEGAFRSFDIECEALRNIIHRNLVKIVTCCSNVDFKALVLDFMSNGSLEKWLHSENCSLDILQRMNIMIDVATALEHLHTGHPTPVIHCDLKPSNILLDEDMVAHVGDFGISKLLGEGDVMRQTMTLATIGYMAPEFGSAGIVSIKCDVYSYGIVLLETFTKKRPTDEFFTDGMTMRDWVKRSLSRGLIDIADADILRREDEYFVVKANCIASIMDLALGCSAELPEERKDMEDVMVELKKIKRRFLNSIEHV